jgi:signal transduction histidine kinase
MMRMERLIIVEDDGVIAAHLQLALEQMGFAIAGTAASGEEALELAEAERPALALMDIGLAGELDGIGTAALLRERLGLPVIYLTAHIDPDTLRRAKTTEPVGYLAKPFQEGSLRTTVEMALHTTEVRRRLRESEAAKRALEVQALLAQKAESLSVMASGIAHIFNNQLQVLIANLEEMRTQGAVAQDAADLLKDALDAAHTAAKASGQLRTYLGQTTGRHSPRDLSELCRDHLPSLRTGLVGEARLECALPSPGPVVMTSVSQLNHILEVLVTNAAEALGDAGGTIRLALDEVAAAAVPVTHRLPVGWEPSASAYARLSVSDEGCGIAPEDVGRVFDPFFTTKFVGRGLGLASALGVVRAHDGAVSVESTPKQGTRVEIFLPIAAS